MNYIIASKGNIWARYKLFLPSLGYINNSKFHHFIHFHHHLQITSKQSSLLTLFFLSSLRCLLITLSCSTPYIRNNNLWQQSLLCCKIYLKRKGRGCQNPQKKKELSGIDRTNEEKDNTWIKSMKIAKKTFAVSVRKLTLIGL